MITISLENGTVISIESNSNENIGNINIKPTSFNVEEILKVCEATDCFVSADYHLCKYLRYDKTEEKYQQYLDDTNKCIELHNKIVGKDDLILFLGDLGESEFGNDMNSNSILEEFKNTVKKLNGNIILLCGNNDTQSDSFYKSCGIKNIIRRDILYGNNICYSHFPCNTKGNNMLNIHGHIHGSHKYWSVNSDNHIDAYWKLWNGPKRISELINLYKNGEYIGEVMHIDANEKSSNPDAYDSHL